MVAAMVFGFGEKIFPASATVNYMTQKMEVEFADGVDEKSVMKSVFKACRKVEPEGLLCGIGYILACVFRIHGLGH